MRKFEKEIEQITASHGCTLYDYADLKGLATGELANFHRGISFVFQMEPWVMKQLAQGPTDAYSVLYGQVNLRIDALAAEVVHPAVVALDDGVGHHRPGRVPGLQAVRVGHLA